MHFLCKHIATYIRIHNACFLHTNIIQYIPPPLKIIKSHALLAVKYTISTSVIKRVFMITHTIRLLYIR